METPAFRYLLLNAGRKICAVRLEQVHEILETRPLSPVPGAPDWCAGALATQIGVVMVVDLAAWIGDEKPGLAEKIIVFDRTIGGLALQVQELQSIATLDEHSIFGENLQLQEGTALILDAPSLLDEIVLSLI